MTHETQPTNPLPLERDSNDPESAGVRPVVAANLSDPYILAERLDYQAMHSKPPFAQTTARESIRGIWWPAELLLADKEPEEQLDVRIEQSFFEAQHVAEHGPSLRERMNAQMFLANLDLLALRGHGRAIEAEDISRSYHMMKGVLADNIERYDFADITYVLVEAMVTYSLIARGADLMNIPFLASPREGRSEDEKRNHTLYTTDDNMTLKTAIAIRHRNQKLGSNKSPGGFVHTHDMRNFLANNVAGLAAIDQAHEAQPELTHEQIVAKLIIDEPHEGYALDSPEDRALTTLSERLRERLNNHRRQLLGLAPVTKAAQAMKGMASTLHSPGATPTPGARATLKPTARRRERTLPQDAYFLELDGKELVNPYLQAEHIPTEVLQRQQCRQDEQIIGSLWRAVELGMSALQAPVVLRVGTEARRIALDRKQEPVARIRAAMLYANSGLLASRVSGGIADPVDIQRSFRAMGGVLGALHSHTYGILKKRYQVGFLAETVNYCLVAYAADDQFIPYLGSRREEQSLMPDANHDMYTLSNHPNASKVAAQVKNTFHPSSKRRLGTPKDPRRTFIFPIYTKAVLQAQAKEMGFAEGRRANIVNDVARLVTGALKGRLSPQEKIYLNGFSAATVRCFAEHKKHLQKSTEFHKMPYTSAPTSQEFIAGL